MNQRREWLAALGIVLWIVAAIAAQVYIGTVPKPMLRASGASTDCAKWLDQAEHFADLRIMGGYSGQAGAVSSAYSLLAIAHGCNR